MSQRTLLRVALVFSIIAIIAALLSGCGDDGFDSPKIEKRDEGVWYIYDPSGYDPSAHIKKTCASEGKRVDRTDFGNEDATELIVICKDGPADEAESPTSTSPYDSVTP